jgi:hypothetical protein
MEELQTGTGTLERAFAIIKNLSDAKAEGARVTQIAKDVGLTQGTVHRTLQALDKMREPSITDSVSTSLCWQPGLVTRSTCVRYAAPSCCACVPVLAIPCSCWLVVVLMPCASIEVKALSPFVLSPATLVDELLWG